MKIDKEDIIYSIFPILFLVIIIGSIVYSCIYPSYYICTDTQGNQITCINVINEKGIYWGIMSDDTYIEITSYKRFEEVNKQIEEKYPVKENPTIYLKILQEWIDTVEKYL